MTFASQGVWQTLHDLISGGRPAVLVTIIGTQGSVPREPGTRMIVCADGGFFGTIGGGTLEFDAIRDARGLLERGDTQSVLETRSLGPDLGQCCGGRVRLLLEVFCDAAQTTHLVDAARLGSFATTTTHKPGMRLARQVIPATGHQSGVIEDGDTLIETFISDQQPVALFGNGHVGRALVLALGALPFRVIWLDGRAEDFPKAVPGNCTPVHMGDPREAVQALPRGTHVMVM
ncbi:MAG: XdhC family protein, partial [Pseudomonadota bacterium]